MLVSCGTQADAEDTLPSSQADPLMERRSQLSRRVIVTQKEAEDTPQELKLELILAGSLLLAKRRKFVVHEDQPC
jgi:hypothetical protein